LFGLCAASVTLRIRGEYGERESDEYGSVQVTSFGKRTEKACASATFEAEAFQSARRAHRMTSGWIE
jgi:hypothetical protein